MAAYRGKNWQTVSWPDGKKTGMILIGRVDGRHLQAQVAHFVREIDRFKRNAVRNKNRQAVRAHKRTFNPEFMGRSKTYSGPSVIEAERDHGPVISALESELRKIGFSVANDRIRDLYVLSRSGSIRILFEAKTDLATSSIYSAVGQLMLHGAAELEEPRLVFVVPEEPQSRLVIPLRKLGIELLRYRWSGDSPIFRQLRKLLRGA